MTMALEHRATQPTARVELERGAVVPRPLAQAPGGSEQVPVIAAGPISPPPLGLFHIFRSPWPLRPGPDAALLAVVRPPRMRAALIPKQP